MPNATSEAATTSCASLRNSLQPTPIQDKIHKGFPEKTQLTTPGFTNSVQQQSFFSVVVVPSPITQLTHSALQNKTPNFSHKTADGQKTVSTQETLHLQEFLKN